MPGLTGRAQVDRLVCMASESTAQSELRRSGSARESLLDAAFDLMYLHGYRAAGIEEILAASGASKGSLYHHFGSKQRLGYAVVEERVKPLVRERYLQPFQESDEPAEAVREMGRRMREELLKVGILERGCPVNNLVQEMSGVDEGFRERLAEVLQEWQDTVAEGLRAGQAAGKVNPQADPDEAGTFVVAVLMGAVGFAKNAQDVVPFGVCLTVLDRFVDTLQPEVAAPTA